MFSKKENYTNKELFEDFPIGKSLKIFALPAIVGQLITLVYNLADTWFVGRLNDPLMMSATSLAFPVFAMSIPVAAIAGFGGGTLISRLMGAHNDEQAKKVGAFTVYLGLALAVAYGLAILIFMDPLLDFLGASSENRMFTKQYLLCVSVFGAVPTILTSVMAELLRSVGHSKEAGFGTAMGGILNIALDPLLMFVIFPREYAVIGAGLATAISNLSSALFYVIKILKLKNETALGFSLKSLFPKRKYVREVFFVGLPSATTMLLFDVNNLILNKQMSAYGDTAVAAMGITVKIERLSLNVCVGLCLGMIPLLAYNYSAGKYERMRGIMKKAITTGITVSLVSIAFYELCAPVFARAFIADPETVALSAAFLRRRAVASVFMFLSFSVVYFFQSIGSGKHTFWLAFMRFACIGIPCIYILDHVFGMYGIPFAQLVADVITSSISWIIYFRRVRTLGKEEKDIVEPY